MNGVEKVFPMAETYVEGIADGNERIQAQIKRACGWSWRESKLKNAAGAGPRITASTVELQCPPASCHFSPAVISTDTASAGAL